MSAEQYRRQLEAKLKQQLEAERKAGSYRSRESNHRSESSKARAAAMKAKSPSTAASKLRDAARHDAAAERAGKEAGRLQTKALTYAKAAATLRSNVTKAESREANNATQNAAREAKLAEQRAAAAHAALAEQVVGVQSEVRQAVRVFRDPRPEKLRILLLGSSAQGDLRIGREQAQIRRAVESSLHRDLVDLDVRPAATTDDLLDGLSKFRPHIVHFSGHTDDALITFEDDVDDWHEGVVVSAAAFSNAVGALDDPPMLVVLNSCNSAGQIDALVESVAPFAIGMQDEIDDADAIAYAARFYSSLANGGSVQEAHHLGRAALDLAGLDSTQLPRLATAIGADATAVRLVQAPAGEAS